MFDVFLNEYLSAEPRASNWGRCSFVANNSREVRILADKESRVLLSVEFVMRAPAKKGHPLGWPPIF
jgi:hypothetical protein